MPQIFTNILNDAIEDPLFDPFAAGQPESISVRLEKMQSGTFAEIYGINWGSVPALVSPTTNLFGTLLVIRNHVFNPNISYGISTVSSFLDVVYMDRLSQFKTKRNIDFSIPLRLEGASDYLIVAAGFTDPDIVPPATILVHLSVRGNIINPSTKTLNLVTR